MFLRGLDFLVEVSGMRQQNLQIIPIEFLIIKQIQKVIRISKF